MSRASHSRLEPHYLWIALGIAAAILYGSFYPFRFYLHNDPRGPLGALLRNGFRATFRDDVVANVCLYIPLGFFTACALQIRKPSAIALATLAGFGLSLCVELGQYYDRGRVQDLADICSNTVGTLLGASAAAIAWRDRMSRVFLAMVLGCWFGSRCYPAPPLPAAVHPLDVFRFFAQWLAVGLMLESVVGASRSRIVLPLFLALVLAARAHAVYTDRSEIAGGAAAALVWSVVLYRLSARAVIAALLFIISVALLALAPFHFLPAARAFGWMPFRSFLETRTDAAIRIFCDKVFMYGGMLWLLVRANLSIGGATAFGAVLIFVLRMIQVYLPGRSAEITDTVLLLMLAAMMKLISLASEPEVDSLERSPPVLDGS